MKQKKRKKTKPIHAYVWPIDYKRLKKSMEIRAKIEKKSIGITGFIEEAIEKHVEQWGIE